MLQKEMCSSSLAHPLLHTTKRLAPATPRDEQSRGEKATMASAGKRRQRLCSPRFATSVAGEGGGAGRRPLIYATVEGGQRQSRRPIQQWRQCLPPMSWPATRRLEAAVGGRGGRADRGGGRGRRSRRVLAGGRVRVSGRVNRGCEEPEKFPSRVTPAPSFEPPRHLWRGRCHRHRHGWIRPRQPPLVLPAELVKMTRPPSRWLWGGVVHCRCVVLLYRVCLGSPRPDLHQEDARRGREGRHASAHAPERGEGEGGRRRGHRWPAPSSRGER